MVMASHWVGLTLPGMIEEPGSFSGRLISPKPERGPEASRRMSLAILNRPVAADTIAPVANTEGAGETAREGGFGVEPGANRGAALRQRKELRPAEADAGDRGLDLRRIAGEL